MKTLLICGASWMFVMATSAFYEKTEADWYTKENPSNDQDLVFLLNKLEDGWAVMANEGRIRGKIYYMASPITSEEGMSYYKLTPLHKDHGEWERGDCGILMMCDVVEKGLKQSDKRFVEVQNVSLGVASSIFKSWREMCSSGNYAKLLAQESTSGYGSKKREDTFAKCLNSKTNSPSLRRIALAGETLHYSIDIGYEDQEWGILCDILDGKVKYLHVYEACL